MIKSKTLLAVPLLLGMAACVTRADFESEPVTVSTAQGPVTCQLYTAKMVDWDTFIERPDTMTEEEANAICVQEGTRLAESLGGPVRAGVL